MGRRCILGLDVGTTSMKAIIINDEGRTMAQASTGQTLLSRFPGWAEEDPNEWWSNAVDVTERCLEEARVKNHDIACVGVSGMVPALLVLDRDGKPLRLSIQQNDARTANEIDELQDLIGDAIAYQVTGSEITQQSIGPKILWLRKHEPEVMKEANSLLGSYDYINFKLTGVLGVERNWALESGLFDPRKEVWAEEIVQALGIDPPLLPPVRASQQVIGTVTKRAASEIGLLEGTPVVAGCADHVASTFAAGILNQGEVNIKIGGAGDILYCTDRFLTSRKLYIDYHLVPNKYLLNGCMASSGSLIKWFVQRFCHSSNRGNDPDAMNPYQQMDDEASRIATSLIVLPYFVGEKTPICDPRARGVIFGLSLNHSPAHIYRALLEAVAFGFRHHLDVMRQLDCLPTRVVATDGGARSPLWCRICADVLGTPVLTLSNHIGSSGGAAFSAGMALGIYHAWEDIRHFVTTLNVLQPDNKAHLWYLKKYQIYLDLYERLREEFPQLVELESSIL